MAMREKREIKRALINYLQCRLKNYCNKIFYQINKDINTKPQPPLPIVKSRRANRQASRELSSKQKKVQASTQVPQQALQK